jgi:hypothetical protein
VTRFVKKVRTRRGSALLVPSRGTPHFKVSGIRTGLQLKGGIRENEETKGEIFLLGKLLSVYSTVLHQLMEEGRGAMGASFILNIQYVTIRVQFTLCTPVY